MTQDDLLARLNRTTDDLERSRLTVALLAWPLLSEAQQLTILLSFQR